MLQAVVEVDEAALAVELAVELALAAAATAKEDVVVEVLLEPPSHPPPQLPSCGMAWTVAVRAAAALKNVHNEGSMLSIVVVRKEIADRSMYV